MEYGFYNLYINIMDQIINENGEWTYEKEIHQANFTVSILGSQSSGKSTLLNSLYQTSFEVLNSKTGRRRCTKGVWIEHNKNENCNIIDTEGTDSNERETKIIENHIALFCLVVADLFLVNIWSNELGRYTGSQYGILKCVFGASLKIFNNPKKTIVFVVKDFVEGQNKEVVKRLINEDMQKIWQQIHEGKKNSPLIEKNFAFEFFFMGHYIKDNTRYIKQAGELRKFIVGKITESRRRVKYIPSSENLTYYKSIWEKICTSKEINVVSQRNMIIQYCCLRAKAICLKAIQILLQRSADSFQANYRTYVLKLKTMVADYYRESTSQLDLTISNQIFKSLQTEVLVMFDIHFSTIQAKMQNIIIDKVIHKRLENVKIHDGLLQRLTTQKQQAIQYFNDFLIGCKTRDLYAESFRINIENTMVRYYQHIHRVNMVFQDEVREVFRQQIDIAIKNLKFNGNLFQKKFQQILVRKFDEPNFTSLVTEDLINSNRSSISLLSDIQPKKLFDQLLVQTLEKRLQQGLLAEIDAHKECPYFWQTEASIIKYFAQLQLKISKKFFQSSILSYLQSREIIYPNQSILLEVLETRFMEHKKNALQTYRSNKRKYIYKPVTIALAYFAFSEYSNLIKVLGLKKLLFGFQMLYIIIVAMILSIV